ncbi:MAG: PAS domain S-box protein [Magnetococcales bacterium]|nr:PAS domain S-box protein [Magnetococcales bacterium]
MTTRKKSLPRRVSPKKRSASGEEELNTEEETNGTGAQKREATLKEQMFVVGIGASAGGLEALRPLVAKLSASANMGYVVVQHMAPQYRSMMVELLARETKIPVIEIKDRTPILPGVVHITPPNHDADIKDGVIFLKPPTNPVGPKPSIDNFFSALAEDQGERAIGVILSGTGSDGALGMRAIKAHGGFTLVQDPESAKYNGMPLAAIETNLIDLILTPDRIGQNLPEIVQTPNKMLELMEDEKSGLSGLDEIFAMVRKRTEIDFSKYKQTTLCRRIERRINSTGTRDLPSYILYMKDNPNEAESLAKDILISVTKFFRDNDAFRSLEEAIHEILRNKEPGDEIRFWVPGCATGEEPYTLAILLSEKLGVKVGGYKIQIFATDIDMEALEAARKGIYLEAALKETPPQYLDRYFTKKGDKFHVSKDLREMVVFARQDLAKDPPFVRVDLITCRNVLIYFNQDLQDRVFSSFHFALASTGFMFLGKSEALGQSAEMFSTTSAKHRIYQKKVGVADRFGRIPIGERVRSTWPGSTHKVVEQKKISVEEAMRSTIMRIYAPKSLMVGDDGAVYQINGDVTGYMVLGSGKGDLNVTRMLIPELRGEFWALFAKVKKTGDSAIGSAKPVVFNGNRKGVRLGIHPATRVSQVNSLYLISFEEFEISEKNVREETGEVVVGDSTRVPELEQELVATKEHLQTVIEELETSNEELQALNEELQASNEEMQSTNEELETANEELQSTNEELTTVNEELQTRTSELMVANADLENMQKNVGYSLIIIDPKLRVKRFSPAAVKFFGLAPEDIGEVITTVPSHLEIKNLKKKISLVISSGKEHQEELLTKDLSLWFRIVPYISMENKIEGAVMVIIDQSEIYSIRQELAHAERIQRLMSDSMPMGVALVSSDRRLVNVNHKLNEWFGQERKLLGKRLFTAFGRKIYDRLKPLISKPDQGESSCLELEHNLSEKETRVFQLLMFPQLDEKRALTGGFILIFEDITELSTTRKDLKDSRERYRTLAESGIQGVLIHQKGKPLYCNHAFARYFGYSNPEQIIRKESVEHLLTDAERQEGANQSKLFGSGHAPEIHEAQGLSKEGKTLQLLSSSRIVTWEGQLAIQTTVVNIKPIKED